MSFWNGTEWVVDAPPDPKRPSRVKRVAAATLEAALVTALTFGLIAGTAFAGKGGDGGKPGGGGGGGGGSHDGAARRHRELGRPDQFRLLHLQPYPVASATCSQGGSVVYGARTPVLAERLGRRWDFHPELPGLDRWRCQLHRLPEGYVPRPDRDARYYLVLGDP